MSSKGAITGTPTTAGSYTFAVVVTDSLGDTATHSYTVIINSTLSMSTTSLANWDKSLAGYKQTVAAMAVPGRIPTASSREPVCRQV